MKIVGGEWTQEVLQAEATVIAKFLRQKLAWHDGNKCQDQYGWSRVHRKGGIGCGTAEG